MKFLSKIIDKRIQDYQSVLAKTHFDEVETMHKEMRGWKHDYKNHIAVLRSYAKDGEVEKLMDYLNQLGEDLAKIERKLSTGNKMADAILNSKLSLAREKNVNVVAEAEILTALTTPDLDLCIILGNLFDNALEASLGLPESQRLIRIYLAMKQNNQLYISFTNFTAAKKQNKIKGRFRTTKGAGRGFGLLRIDQIVERHSGYISRNSEDGVFSTEILLPQ